MTTATQPLSKAAARPKATSASAAIPWYLFAVALASTSVVVGVIWDISWHRTIGRDTFWTPAHLAIYLGGVVAGFSCGWLALKTTFAGSPQEKASGVKFWGFRAPLGAWICIWGAFAMITSGPFDDWWHNAYGLDVEILSPPHTVLALGIITIQIGAMLMVLARQNTFAESHRGLSVLFGYTAGVLALMLAVMATDYIGFPNHTRRVTFYTVASGIFPVLLVGASRASKLRWGATAAAAVYMAVTMLMIWILQLFPATPLLGPIYNPVDHMVPPAFPLLLIVPAVAIDMIIQRLGDDVSNIRLWGGALVAGLAFLAAFAIAQLLFAEFLLSPAARNFFFAADQWDYNVRLGDWRYDYWDAATTSQLARGWGWALVLGAVSARIGLAWGNWMTRVRR